MRRALLTFSALLTQLVSLGMPAAAWAADDAVVRHTVTSSGEQDAAVRSYWTPGRIAALDPVPARVNDSTPAGPEGAEWQDGTAVTHTVGRLFFSKTDGDESCTATVVNSHNQSVAVTAAHCVRDSNLKPDNPVAGDWTSRLLFVPGFREGQAPFGAFTIREVVISRAWVQPGFGFLNHDIAFLVLNRGADGYTVESKVGAAQRIAFGSPTPRSLRQFGYPRYSVDGSHEGHPAFRGQRLSSCWGSAQVVDYPDYGMLRSEGVPCVMGSGASGGPHMRAFDTATGIGTVVGVNSYLGSGQVNAAAIYLMGPPLTRSDRALYEAAQQGRP